MLKRFITSMGLVFDGINNAYVLWLFERLKRNQMEQTKQIVRWTYGYCIALLGVVALAFIIGSPLLILIAGEKYSAATEIIGWMALGQSFSGMYLMVTIYLIYSKRTFLLSLPTIYAGLINVGLLLCLIILDGFKKFRNGLCGFYGAQVPDDLVRCKYASPRALV